METPLCQSCGKSIPKPSHRSFEQWQRLKHCDIKCRTRTPESRFWAKVDRSGGPDACWPWLAYRSPQGYGSYMVATGVSARAHRYAWVLQNGPTDLTLDHLCRNRACVNPAHLEPVTLAENYSRVPPESRMRSGSLMRSKTHCKQGHPYDAANTRWQPGGRRICIECKRESVRRSRARHRSVNLPVR